MGPSIQKSHPSFFTFFFGMAGFVDKILDSQSREEMVESPLSSWLKSTTTVPLLIFRKSWNIFGYLVWLRFAKLFHQEIKSFPCFHFFAAGGWWFRQ